MVTVGPGTAFVLLKPGDSVVEDTQPPSQPCFKQDVVRSASELEVVLEVNVVVSTQPPNHPYFTQDVEGKVVLEVEEVVEVTVVDSSRQPVNVNE